MVALEQNQTNFDFLSLFDINTIKSKLHQIAKDKYLKLEVIFNLNSTIASIANINEVLSLDLELKKEELLPLREKIQNSIQKIEIQICKNDLDKNIYDKFQILLGEMKLARLKIDEIVDENFFYHIQEESLKEFWNDDSDWEEMKKTFKAE